MLSIAVCDDEVLDCCHMEKAIRGILEELGTPFLIRQFHSGRDLLQAAESFDLIFLDILMDGVGGMKAAQMLRVGGYDRMLVFVSSSREYVFDAYDVEAFQYLPKPVDLYKLKKVLQRAAGKSEHGSGAFLVIQQERQKKKLYLKDIYYFEIKGRIVSVHSAAGTFDYYEKISALERALQGKWFFRCHKSFLVNLGHVDTYNRQEAVLDNGETVVIARRRYEAFGREFLEFMKQSEGIYGV